MIFEESENGSECDRFAVEQISAKSWHVGLLIRPSGACFQDHLQGL